MKIVNLIATLISLVQSSICTVVLFVRESVERKDLPLVKFAIFSGALDHSTHVVTITDDIIDAFQSDKSAIIKALTGILSIQKARCRSQYDKAITIVWNNTVEYTPEQECDAESEDKEGKPNNNLFDSFMSMFNFSGKQEATSTESPVQIPEENSEDDDEDEWEELGSNVNKVVNNVVNSAVNNAKSAIGTVRDCLMAMVKANLQIDTKYMALFSRANFHKQEFMQIFCNICHNDYGFTYHKDFYDEIKATMLDYVFKPTGSKRQAGLLWYFPTDVMAEICNSNNLNIILEYSPMQRATQYVIIDGIVYKTPDNLWWKTRDIDTLQAVDDPDIFATMDNLITQGKLICRNTVQRR